MNKLSLDNITRMKGILCVAVLFHHINQCLTCFDNTVIDLLLNQLGYLSVAGFYFFSGYGLTSQAIINEKYEKKMWLGKIIPFYFIYLIVCAFYSIMNAIVGGTPSLATITRTFFFGGTIVRNGWYFQSLLVFYFIFWIVFRFFKNKKTRILMIALLTIGYIASCLLLKLDAMWYQSAFVFLMGVAWRFFEDKLSKYIKWWTALIVSLLFGGFFMGAKLIDVPAIAIIMKALSAHCIVLILLSVIYLVPIWEKLKLCKWLGKYSMEIYAFHGLMLILFRWDPVRIQNDLLFAVTVICATLILSVLIHPVFSFVNKYFKKLAVSVYNEKDSKNSTN